MAKSTECESIVKKRSVKAALAAGAIIMFGATPALASVDVGGGKWSYGVGCCTLWSNYYHTTEKHSSSVHGGPWAYSGCTATSKWSLASAEEGSYNDAYWDKGC